MFVIIALHTHCKISLGEIIKIMPHTCRWKVGSSHTYVCCLAWLGAKCVMSSLTEYRARTLCVDRSSVAGNGVLTVSSNKKVHVCCCLACNLPFDTPGPPHGDQPPGPRPPISGLQGSPRCEVSLSKCGADPHTTQTSVGPQVATTPSKTSATAFFQRSPQEVHETTVVLGWL